MLWTAPSGKRDRLGEVVRSTEPDMAIVVCFEPINAHCTIRPGCVLRRALEKARLAFVEVLDGYTLSDLVKPKASLRTLLSLTPSDGNELCCLLLQATANQHPPVR